MRRSLPFAVITDLFQNLDKMEERACARFQIVRAARGMATANSCESKCSSAYSDDLWWQIVGEREALRHTTNQIAVYLCISESTVRRIIQRFETSGEVSKREYPLEAPFRKSMNQHSSS